MNEPIISPWVFYWIDELESISNFLSLLIGFSFVFVLALFVARSIEGDKILESIKLTDRVEHIRKNYSNDYHADILRMHNLDQENLNLIEQNIEEGKELIRDNIKVLTFWFRFLLAVLVISILTNTFLPKKETAYKMLIASQLTKQNLQDAGGTVSAAIDKVGNTADAALDKATERLIKIVQEVKK